MAKKTDKAPTEQAAVVVKAPDEVLLDNLRKIWEKYQKQIAGVLLLAAVVLVGSAVYRNHVRTETEEGWTALAESYAATDVLEARRKCEQYVNTAGATRATPWVKLRLLQVQLAMGDAEGALKTSSELMAAYRDKPVAEIAQPLHAAALEAARRYAEAAQTFEALAQKSPKKLASRYWWDAGRNREAAAATALAQNQKDVADKQLESAREAYEKAQQGEPSAIVRELAAARLAQLSAGAGPRLIPTPAIPPPPEPPSPDAAAPAPPHAPIPGTE